MLAVACAGTSVRPETVRAEGISSVQLSADSTRDLGEHVDRAVAAVVRRRYVEAEAEAGAALEIDPRCARARAVLGMVRFQKAALVEPPDLFLAHSGEAELLLAEQIAPTDAFVGWMRAVFLAEAGHMSAAAAAAESALVRCASAPPAERAALLGIAGTYRYELGEERAALPHLQAYVGLRPDDAAASFRVGVCLLRIAEVPMGPEPTSLLVAQRNAEGAARAFRRCEQLAPGDEDAAMAVGAAALRAAELAEQRGDEATGAERRREAEQQFRDLAARFPASAEPLFRLGVAAEARRAVADAREAYAQALQRDPDHLGSLLNLAALHEASGPADPATVRRLLERALQVDSARAGLTEEERRSIEARLRQRGDEGETLRHP